jgi:hypothetical protein
MALLGTLMATVSGCHPRLPAARPLMSPERERIYAAVLRDMRRDTTTRWLVLDTLLPTTDIEADQYDVVREGLLISERELHGFLAVQRMPTARVVPGMLPDEHWRLVSGARLDSLRTLARREVATGAVQRRVRTDQFWQLWYRAYPSSGGYVVLSPASLSANGALALVHVRTACGPVCGESELRVLRRDAGGRWQTTHRVSLSES